MLSISICTPADALEDGFKMVEGLPSIGVEAIDQKSWTPL